VNVTVEAPALTVAPAVLMRRQWRPTEIDEVLKFKVPLEITTSLVTLTV
jgi:hypothetical protein